MNEISGNIKTTYSDIADIAIEWVDIDDLHLSFSKIWDLYTTIDLNYKIQKYSGGNNGRMIAQHTRTYRSAYSSHTITMIDHHLNSIYTYRIDDSCDDIFFHVTPDDHLIVLTTNGKLFTFFGNRLESSGSVDADEPIVAAAFWDTGFVFATLSLAVYKVPFFKDTVLLNQYADMGQPAVFEVIPPSKTSSGEPIIFASDADGDLHVITKDSQFKMKMISPITCLSISPNYEYVALIVQPMTLITMTITLDSLIFSLDIEEGEDFIQLGWMGDYCPAVSFEGTIVVPIKEDCIQAYDIKDFGLPVMFSCSDGTLVFTSEGLYKLTLVSEELSRVVNSYPFNPASKLLDAFCKKVTSIIFELDSAGQLDQAITDLISSSYQMIHAEKQQLVLLAAEYGRSYSKNKYSQEFADAITILRQVNEFKTDFGIIIPPNDLKDMNTKPSDLVMRICNRGMHSVALEFADYVFSEKSPVFTDWCSVMFNDIQDDELVIKIIQAKKNQYFDFNAICCAARDLGRGNVATKLAASLKNRTSVIPFYMQSELWEDAIEASAQSCDSDLFIHVIKKAIKAKDEKYVANAISRNPISYGILVKYVSSNTESEMKNVLNQVTLTNATIENVMKNEIHKLIGINDIDFYRVALNNLQTYNEAFPSVIVQNNIEMLKANMKTINVQDDLNQKAMSTKYHLKSINQTLELILLENGFDAVLENGVLFGLSKKRIMHLIVNILLKKDSFHRFKMLADPKYKANYNFLVFACETKWGRERTLEFIQSIPDPKKQAELTKSLQNNEFDINNSFGSNSYSCKLFKSSII